MPATIRTREFTLTPGELARLSVSIYRPLVTGVSLLVLVLLVVVFAAQGIPPIVYFPAGLAGALGSYFSFPILMRRSLSRPAFAANYAPRTVELDGDLLRQTTQGGAVSEVPVKQFKKFELRKGFYLLTLAPGSFIGVPVSAFISKEDEGEFRERISREVSWGGGG